MIKSIVAYSLVHVFAFFAFFQNYSVNVHQVVPVTLAEGESQEVKIIFEKNEVSGFAKFEVEVEEGIEISAGDIGSASFTFENNIAKFIWFALPEEESFSVTYMITNASAEIGSSKSIRSQFSYLENNAKKIFTCPEHVINIESLPNQSMVAINEIAIESPEKEEAEVALSPAEKLEAIRNHEVKIDREFQRLESGLYQMNIKINKGPISGFAKLEEVVPDGFEYAENETSGSIFTKIKGKAKFVWFNVPETEEVEISYHLRAEEANVVGLHNITGEFTYLVDDQDVKSQSIPAFFQINSQDLENALENDAIGTTEKEAIVEAEIWQEESFDTSKKRSEDEIVDAIEESLIEQSEKTGISGIDENEMSEEVTEEKSDTSFDQPLTKNVQTASSEKNTTSSEAIAADAQDLELPQNDRMFADADEGITYRIQICATRKMADVGYFKKNEDFNFPVILENHEGWFKYTTGDFSLYQKARNSREGINANYNFDGPFVTAYNDGERISVQEALMISNQRWFK